MSAKPNSLLASVQTGAAAKMSYSASNATEDARSIPVSKIQPRLSGDVRELRPQHILDLAQTINALGLLQSITVDANKRLLAGKHRLAACQLLFALPGLETPRERVAFFNKLVGHDTGDRFAAALTALEYEGFLQQHPDGAIPCRLMPFDAAQSPADALQAEIVENEKRLDHTKSDIERMVVRLKEQGFVERNSRPVAGEKALKPALALLIGKSTRQLRRILNEPAKSKESPPPAPASVSHLPALLRVLQKALPELKNHAKLRKHTATVEALHDDLEKHLSANTHGN